jgi:hypothetical protein
MRGFPLLNLWVLAVLLGLAAVPLVRISMKTGPDKLTEESGKKKTLVDSIKCDVRIRLAHGATGVRLVEKGKVLHEWMEAGVDFEETLDVSIFDRLMEFEVIIF